MKKVLLIGDYCEREIESYLKKFAKATYNKSGINYQENLFLGFEKVLGVDNVEMICCPTYGSYPKESTLAVFPEFQSKRPNIKYVKFNNLRVYRNISRTFNLKKAVKRYLKGINADDELLVVVFQMHYPFMKALHYIKKVFGSTKACINIWDYPNYVDFRANNLIKRVLKKVNYSLTMRLLRDYDLFFYLSEKMKEKNAYNKNYIVHEGIISSLQLSAYCKSVNSKQSDGKFHIVYTGRLTKYDGVLDLINAVENIDDFDVVLDIAGGGEILEDVLAASKKSTKINFHGSLSRDETRELQCGADLFVLPRLPEEYTKYSFPSKLCEYILTGKPILTRRLDCFDEYLLKQFYLFEGDDNENLSNEIAKTIAMIKSGKKSIDYSDFIEKNLEVNIAKEIMGKFYE